MKTNRLKHSIIQMLIFIATYLLAKFMATVDTVGSNIFGWAVHNDFFHLWILPLIFTLLGSVRTGYTIVTSNVIGLFIGQYLGDYLRALNVSKITPNMSNEEIYRLNSHKGYFIWIGTILLSMLLVWVISFIHRIIVNRKNRRPKQN